MSSEIVDSQELTTFIPQFTTCMWISCGKVLVKVVKIMVVAFMVNFTNQIYDEILYDCERN